MRVAFLGPSGTFSEEALAEACDEPFDAVHTQSFHGALAAVAAGAADRAFVPIENSLEGPVNATLDALLHHGAALRVVGEEVHPVRHLLVARTELPLPAIETVLSHPQPIAQCAGFLRDELPSARVVAATSTAEAVRTVAAEVAPWAAIGTRRAADAYGCVVLREGVEDEEGNETRFVWVAAASAAAGLGRARSDDARWKTSVAFWGAGTDAPGWLVRCLSELSTRGVNLTKIESRPTREGLGSYRFFVDLDGRDDDPVVAEALAGLRSHCEHVRTLGSFPAA